MSTSTPRLSLTRPGQELLYRFGLPDLLRAANPRRLTVFAYHRINDSEQAGFNTFAPNVSATPERFAAQMDYVARHYKVIDIQTLTDWIEGRAVLPRHPALITFDDGYADNLQQAFPILQARRLPAVIFLATDYIGRQQPFYWDLVAYCFKHTQRDHCDLPGLGACHWSTSVERETLIEKWIAKLKTWSDDEKNSALAKLPERLNVSVPETAFAGLHLSWDQVRFLSASGITMGAHTCSHPILTRLSLAQAKLELEESRRRIESEISAPVVSFAYPNGRTADFNIAIQHLVQEAGYVAAFTLLSGPTSWIEVQAAPLAIRRIYVGRDDTLPRFAAKASGLARFIKRDR